eukprot:Lankesteria_metandrocarpae@DN6755_c0_g1_i1.p1
MAPPGVSFVSVGATLGPGATARIGRKVAGGLQTCNNLLLIDKDLVSSYRGYSQKMNEASERARRGVANMTSTVHCRAYGGQSKLLAVRVCNTILLQYAILY